MNGGKRMKIFETPVIEVVKFTVEDIITLSGGSETTTSPDPILGFDPMPCF